MNCILIQELHPSCLDFETDNKSTRSVAFQRRPHMLLGNAATVGLFFVIHCALNTALVFVFLKPDFIIWREDVADASGFIVKV